MTTAPWKAPRPVPRAISDVPGQTELGERLLYYWLASEQYTGAGEIVEIGTLVGSSSICFSAGLADNPRVTQKAGRIHAYDRFITMGDLGGFLQKHYPEENLQDGSDFSHLYRRNVQQAGNLIQLTQVDALEARWSGKPIEILFIDCAVSGALYDHLIAEFYPSLIPDRSFVVDQDFFFQRAPWLPVKSERLNMTPLFAEASTLVSRPNADTFSRIEGMLGKFDKGPYQDNIAALQNHARKFPPEHAQMLEVQEARLLIENERREEGIAKARAIIVNPRSSSASYRAKMVLQDAGVPLGPDVL